MRRRCFVAVGHSVFARTVGKVFPATELHEELLKNEKSFQLKLLFSNTGVCVIWKGKTTSPFLLNPFHCCTCRSFDEFQEQIEGDGDETVVLWNGWLDVLWVQRGLDWEWIDNFADKIWKILEIDFLFLLVITGCLGCFKSKLQFPVHQHEGSWKCALFPLLGHPFTSILVQPWWEPQKKWCWEQQFDCPWFWKQSIEHQMLH